MTTVFISHPIEEFKMSRKRCGLKRE